MKLYRFMSITECANLIKGKILVNKTDHSQKRGTASTAKGFCFGIGERSKHVKTSDTSRVLWTSIFLSWRMFIQRESSISSHARVVTLITTKWRLKVRHLTTIRHLISRIRCSTNIPRKYIRRMISRNIMSMEFFMT